MRYRTKLTNMLTSEKNRALNCLTVSNLKLDDVFSNVFGKSSRSIIRYILEHPGETFQVAPFIDRRCKHPVEEIQAAVDGAISREQAAKLRECLLHIDQLNGHRETIETEILRLAQPYSHQLELLRTVPGFSAAPLTAVWNVLSKLEPYGAVRVHQPVNSHSLVQVSSEDLRMTSLTSNLFSRANDCLSALQASLAAMRPICSAGGRMVVSAGSIMEEMLRLSKPTTAMSCGIRRPCALIALIAAQAFAGANYTWGWVPYTDPGANLTFAIRDELRRVEAETGKVPSVILMQNHGIIVHDDDPDTALAIHTDANERLARMFGLTGTSFPKIAVREMAAGIYAADVPYLAEQFRTGGYTQEFLMTQPLYPDQMVFLTDTFYLDQEMLEAGQAVASSKTGELLMQMDEKKALTLTETLTAVFFVMEHIRKAGYELSTMGEAAKKFIANWESEKYRKSLAGKKA